MKINPNYGGSTYVILVFPILTAVYFQALGQRNKFVFIITTILFSTFAIINLLYIQQSTINSYTLVLMSIVMIVLGLYYFYWLLKVLPTTQLQNLPMFWINSAFMIYNAGNLFLFLFTSYLVHVLNDNLLLYWTLHNVLGIIEALIIIVALAVDIRNIRTQQMAIQKQR